MRVAKTPPDGFREASRRLLEAVGSPLGEPEYHIDPVARTAIADLLAHPQKQRNTAAVALQHVFGGGFAQGRLDLGFMVEPRTEVALAAGRKPRQLREIKPKIPGIA